jgi:septum formation protein
MQSFQLTLASQSPQRRQLLDEAGYAFDVIVPHESAECGICSRETPPELVNRLARQKAANVAKRVGRGLVLGCDTVAECRGQILGKPKDLTHARQMLTLLRGRTHHVYSGVCLWRRPDDQSIARVATTKLRMEPITDRQLEQYLKSGCWEGKAGAFGFQDQLSWIEILAGSESNVVGLPLELLSEMLPELV